MNDEEYKENVIKLMQRFDYLSATVNEWIIEEKEYREESKEWREANNKALEDITKFITERKIINGYEDQIAAKSALGEAKCKAETLLRITDCKTHFEAIDICLKVLAETSKWHTKVLWFIFIGIFATFLERFFR